MTLHEMFAQFEDDRTRFEAVENKLSNRPDLHAFILLNQLQPKDCDMVSAAEHDQIFLDVDCDELAKVITLDQVHDLTRCGVWYDEGLDCLTMFV
jgi:hypothetical protein